MALNTAALAKRLRDRTGVLKHVMRVYHEGEIVEETEQPLDIRDGQLANAASERFVWQGERADWGDVPGFLEENICTTDGQRLFITKYHEPSYSLNWATGRKSYMINVSPKFADPRVIEQIAQFNFFIDTSSTIWIDRDRDCDESLLCVNPFTQPIVVKLDTNDGRTLRGNRVPPLSARRIMLSRFLRDDESSWQGQVQIVANNRLQVSLCKHSFNDANLVTDVEHLDPYRTDPTHQPASQWIRAKIGEVLQDRGIDTKHL